ncbi:site-specific DNA-methyltransferase [Komagataeibacter diospyri]|uniref:site-specific DNA-methyltransferase (adenine-specific) n=1 Tax=Komagataeibacter diospyri TaxID=1932662 RepID=A0A4P5P1R7_9PROT|nr:site-specific DNA-methyltransferase [Komagataeibacter diospyri]GCE84589.1 adenine-specific DNA-methyltransferase [Komagataeibacter diospyri]GCE91462.1 adenine-specific DNA-methyltransferase [Komagataeibacter diospyri]
MATLEWEGKHAVTACLDRMRAGVLQVDPALCRGAAEGTDMVILGDNLAALGALMPDHEGQVDMVLIDPPYNTGRRDWLYDDSVSNPAALHWLGDVLGPQRAASLSRQDRWLCLMYPRLLRLRQLMAENGVIACCIDDREYPRLRLLMEEVFGPGNFLATFVWVNTGNIDNHSRIKTNHEYVVVFARDARRFVPGCVLAPQVGARSKLRRPVIRNTIIKNGPRNPVSDLVLPAGFPARFDDGVIPVPTDPGFWPRFDVPIVVRNGRLAQAVTLRSGWSSRRQCAAFIAAGFRDITDRQGLKTRFYLTPSGAVFMEKDRQAQPSHILTVLEGMGTVQQAATELAQCGVCFDYPKPLSLVTYLLRALCPAPDAVVLDAFGGSGTTAQAVMDLNAADGGTRRFVVMEMDERIATTVTQPRLAHVLARHARPGAGFRFCRLGMP